MTLPFKLSLMVFPDLSTVSPAIKLIIFNLLRGKVLEVVQ
jgi:hypothetical protein